MLENESKIFECDGDGFDNEPKRFKRCCVEFESTNKTHSPSCKVGSIVAAISVLNRPAVNLPIPSAEFWVGL